MSRRRNGTLELKIPTFAWKQIGGDMSADKYGGTIAEADGDHIELLKIQPVREYIGEREAKDVGHPFWTREAWFELDDLDPFGSNAAEVKSALQSIGVRVEDGELVTESGDIIGEVMGEPSRKATPEIRALVIAEALLDHGRADEGPAGWGAEDIYPERMVEWSYGKPMTMAEYLADEDAEFRREVLGERYEICEEGEGTGEFFEDEDAAIEAAHDHSSKLTVTVVDRFDDEVVWSSEDEDEEQAARSENPRRRNATPGALRADPRVRYETRWKIGKPGAVYEFRVKFHKGDYSANVDDETMHLEVQHAVRAFADVLRGRFSWVGNVSITGRSGGWLAVEDKLGKATPKRIGEVADMVDDARKEFGKYLDEEYG